MTLNLILTRAGAAEIEAAYRDGEVITLKDVAIGDGNGQPVSADENATALTGEFGREPFSAGNTEPGLLNGTVVIPAARYPQRTLRELGLMSDKGTLIAYAAYPETYLPAQTDTIIKEVIVDFIMPLVHATSVVLQVDPDRALMTRELADKRYLRTDLNLLEIQLRGQQAQKEGREALDVVDGTLVKKGLVQLTNLTNPADKTSEKLALTPQALQEYEKTMAPYLLPVGVIVAWGSAIPPDGWIEANGQQFSSVTNPKLSAVYPSGRVPDLRGRFIRGWAHGSPVDPDADRAMGSNQAQSVIEHDHGIALGWRGDGGNGKDSGPAYMRFPDPKNEEIRTERAGGGETRPVNTALMYIVKTDGAEAIAPAEPLPTTLLISPAIQVVEAGKTQQFAATVLPVALAGEYPVSWAVADNDLGSTDQTGRYQAAAGKAGTQTLIATISSGLTATATITQHIFARTIAMSAIPLQGVPAGSTFTPNVVVNPANATEPLVYTSTNESVFSFSNGVISANAAGLATVTVTGLYSGVSVFKTGEVTAVNDLAVLGGVGSYAFLTGGSSVAYKANSGMLYPASDLYYAGTVVTSQNPRPAGTWMCCGSMANTGEKTLFRRVA